MDFSTIRYTFRSVRRHRGYTLLNVGGLAVGLSAAVIILLFVRDELSYDRFHPEADRIYNLDAELQYQADLTLHLRGMPAAMGPSLKEELPAVEYAMRWDDLPVRFTNVGDIDGEEVLRVTDPDFFQMLNFRLVQGDRETALSQPDALVVTESAAERYFGRQEAVGRTLSTEYGDIYTVTGVIEDPPHNTEFDFDFLTPWVYSEGEQTDSSDSQAWNPIGQKPTFVRLRGGTTPEEFSRLVRPFIETHMGVKTANKFTVKPQRLVDLHLYRNRGSSSDGLYGNVTYVWMFSGIALLILVIACINYTNMATARALQRAREVGIRKSVGAQRGQLIRRFLGESMVLTLAATLLAVMIVDWGLPAFSRLTGKEIAANWLSDPWLLPGLLALTVAVGLFAGMYPSLVLSRFEPVRALKGRVSIRDTKASVRKSLVAFQFVMSVGLIICTIVMHRQLGFMLNRDLGIEPDQVVSLRLPIELTDRYPALKNEISKISTVAGVAAGSPLRGNYLVVFDEDVPLRPEGGAMFNIAVDEDFVGVMDMELVVGHNFSSDRTAATEEPVLVNETAVRELGLDDPVGTVIRYSREGDSPVEIVGVVQDYHYQSLKRPIMPLMIRQNQDRSQYMVVRVGAGDVQATLSSLATAWSTVIPDEPLNYRFLDEQFESLYRTEQRIGRLFTLAAGLAVFVSCLGLFGLAAFSAQQRTKEIGIRKVLGASVSNLVGLVSREFLLLVGIAFVVAAPLTWFAMNRWLEDYAYRIEIGPGLLALAGVLAVLITVATIGWQALRAATADPVDSLRME